MSKLIWGELSNRVFETGVDRGVLYVGDNPGVPWDGLISIDDASDGGAVQEFYLDGEKFLSLSQDANFKAKLVAYSSPPEFDLCDGMAFLRNGLFATAQPRKPFGLCYRTMIGNGSDGTADEYKIHLIYNAMAAPTNKSYKSMGDKPNLTNFTWDISTTRLAVTGAKPTAHFVIDSSKAYDWAISALEDILYGNDSEDPRLPTPDEVVNLFEDNSIVKITDNGDGTWTADGPDSAVYMSDANTFVINWPSAVYLDDAATTYAVTSL